MNKKELEDLCYAKEEELLDKYFPNFIKDAAINRPEKLAEEYSNDIPDIIRDEFWNWLEDLWRQECESFRGTAFEKIMDRRFQMEDLDKEFRPILQPAREDAETITLWEKITQSNHEDVTYYKGLLRQYSRAMMNTMLRDMLEDV